MGWRDWPYWLKGGVTLLIIDLMIVIPTLVSCLIKQSNYEGAGWIILWTQFPFILLGRPLIRTFTGIFHPFSIGNVFIAPELFIGGLIGLIGYFITGAIIGFIIGISIKLCRNVEK